MLHQRHFRAMNTDVGLWLWSTAPQAEALLDQVQRYFIEVEAELSRFRPDSALSRLNAAAGQGPQPLSPLLQAVLVEALRAAAASDGLFDPTLLAPIQQAGYDRSFDELAQPPANRPEQRNQHQRHGREQPRWGWRLVRLNPKAGIVELPAGVGIDLGGIAKGWTVDRAAEMLGAWGPALVDAGGDIRVIGTPEREAWPIAVQDPFDEAYDLMVLALRGGGLATSSVGGRRWQRDGRTMHHLIDPRTGQPSQSDLHTVTVLAPTTVQAEVAAKVALILGRQRGTAFLKRKGLASLLLGPDGQQTTVGELPLWVATQPSALLSFSH